MALEHKKKLSSFNHDLQIVVQGMFDYYNKKEHYSEESFRVYKNIKNNDITYETEANTRLRSGEMLKVYTIYKVNKNWVPLNVTINTTYGVEQINQKFVTNLKTSGLHYTFNQGTNPAQETSFQIPPKFQIATPNVATSCVFIVSKKYDATGKNYHNLVVSENAWNFIELPKMQFVTLLRKGNEGREIKINNTSLKTMIYEVFSQEEQDRSIEHPLTLYMSEHFGIPYRISDDFGLKIEVRYLNKIDAPSYN